VTDRCDLLCSDGLVLGRYAESGAKPQPLAGSAPSSKACSRGSPITARIGRTRRGLSWAGRVRREMGTSVPDDALR
jgi:hypothetical protein